MRTKNVGKIDASAEEVRIEDAFRLLAKIIARDILKNRSALKSLLNPTEEVQTGAPEIETKKEENKEWQCVR